MKRLIVFFIALSILGCENSSPLKYKAENVQTCLDLLYKDKEFRYLEKCQLVLIKDNYTSDLDNLHFGANKFMLKEVDQSTIKKQYLSKDDTSKRFFMIKYTVVNENNVTVELEFRNGSEAFHYYLVKKDSVWKIDHVIPIIY
jgi:hypothetical protein